MADNKNKHIIAIGASAGGIEAIYSFFEHTPLDKVSYIVIQHLSPDYKSKMAELLARHSKLEIYEAKNNMPVEENKVYLISNKDYMTIRKGKLHLTNKQEKESPHLTINTFFNSLAEERGEKAIGIILSGTGSDGSRGIEAIKKAGGMVMVQDPATAKFDAMPVHAISTGFADAVLAPEAMPEVIKNYVDKKPWKPAVEVVDDESVLSDILHLIQEQLPHDFSNYKRSTLLRRTKKRMVHNNFSSLDHYFAFLKKNPAELALLVQDFFINVTAFFRDREAFELIETDIIPEIVDKHLPENVVKIWVAGCATGEEAYSLAILFKEYLDKINKRIEVKIFATDIDQDALSHASKGIYPQSIAQDVSEKRLKRFFSREGDRFKIKQEVRKMLIFAQHDVVKNPPYCNLDLISCRNLLIYMDAVLQKKVFSMLHFGLKKGGYLFLGTSESANMMNPYFLEVSKKWKIYKNTDASRTTPFHHFSLPVIQESRTAGSSMGNAFDASHGKNDIFQDVNEAVMNECGFAGVSIDENYNIVQVFGDISKYLLQKMFTFNLKELLPKPLAIAVGAAIPKALKRNEKVVIKGIKINPADNGQHKAKNHSIKLLVKPFAIRKNDRQLMLLLFSEDASEAMQEEAYEPFDQQLHTHEYLADLEEELRETRESLQTALDKLEAQNENMQSFNEELLSANEEMQSSNEELESINEELQTINQEYQQKNKELASLNDDLDNYFRSNLSGQLYVDQELLLKRFSPTAIEQINLRKSDIGRPIHNITTNINFGDLAEDLKIVIQKGKIITREVQSSAGKWYQMKTMPYIRQSDHKQDGAVVTFNDITQLKKAQEDLDDHLKQLMRVNEDLDNFVYAASHDLTAPISRIESLFTLLFEKTSGYDPEVEKYKEMMTTSFAKFKAMIKELTEIGKIESEIYGKMDPVNFNELYEDIRLGMLDQITAANASLSTDFQVKEIRFLKKNIRSILYNLISNAIKYKSPDRNPEVIIKTQSVPGFLLLSVTDNGMGIEDNKIEKVFSLYGRLGQQVEGKGIGLYLVKKIINATGGKIEVDSEVDKGTTFSVFFKR